MNRRLSPLLALGVTLTFAHLAHAASDSEALKLAEAAIYEDYLNLDFKASEGKLNKALALCKADCRPDTKARLYRDLGVLYVAGLQKRAQGVSFFSQALAADPNVKLDADLATADLEAAFAEAKSAPSGSGDPTLDAAMRSSVGPVEEEPAPEPPPEPPPEEPKETTPVLTESPEPEPEPERQATPMSMTEEDCPPDFPGCKSVDGGPDQPSGAGDDGPRHWFSLGFQADFLLLAATRGVCVGTEFQCFQSTYYRNPNTPTGVTQSDGSVGGAGDVGGGPVLGTMRVLAGYDYAVLPELLLGVRAGFAFNGGPDKVIPGYATESFQPVHAEVRGAYWFLGSQTGSVRPFIEVSGGVAQVDARVQLDIIDRSTAQVNACELQGRGNDSTCLVVPVDAWKKTGVGFVGGGLGTMFAFGDSHGLVLEARVMQMLGSSGTALGGQLGYTFGI